MTGQELLKKIRTEYVVTQILFRFPYVYVYVYDKEWVDTADEIRKYQVTKKLGVTEKEFDEICHNCFLRFEFLSANEPLSDDSRSTSFLGSFCHCKFPDITLTEEKSPRIVHFYGYKGGQARSTVLACVGRQLAEKGYRVLVVDADIEAPSLHKIFGVAPKTTLIQLVNQHIRIEPVACTCFIPSKGTNGKLDLIACRSNDLEEDNLEYAAFSLWANISPIMLEDVAEKILSFAQYQRYDVILFDHRSGFAIPTLPWMQTLPGPCVLCMKLDGQWESAKFGLRSMLECNVNNPGVVVYFKPDDENADNFDDRTRTQRYEIADILAQVNVKGADLKDDVENSDPITVEDRFIRWDYDRAFRGKLLPNLDGCTKTIREAIGDVISFLDLSPHQVEKSDVPKNSKRQTASPSISGAKDAGLLIQTEMFQKLIVPNNNIDYIFGRKGAGKTRMLKELADKGIGEPLLVDPEYTGHGIQTNSSVLEKFRKSFGAQNDKKDFWFGLLFSGLQTKDSLREDLELKLQSLLKHWQTDTIYDGILKETSLLQSKRTFLIDGVELAFSTDTMGGYVKGLFAFVRQLQTDARLKDKIRVKLFLRKDLLKTTVIQNLEQQLEGREIELRWNYQRILNFFLSRIPVYPFFSNSFKTIVKKIEDKKITDDLVLGNLPQEKCESLLKEIFPEKLRRSNIGLSTYFRLHFSDSFSSKNDSSYYPRVFLNFLEAIEKKSEQKGSDLMENGLVAQSVIITAQENAATRFLNEAEQELTNILKFGKDGAIDVTKWLNCFEGQQTPFDINTIVDTISKKWKEILSQEEVRENLNRMKDFGMFETLSSEGNKWRVSRLYKPSLKMKFNRG